MTDIARTTTTWWVEGAWTPVPDELTAFDLPVRGTVPDALAGMFVRNGPNQIDGIPSHVFTGDGMVHGVELRDGRALSYRNRWVQTRQLRERAARITPDGRRDITVGSGNTHVLAHGGRVLALNEQSLPVALDRELATIGLEDFGGRLQTGLTAHPKVCPVTGELHGYGYDVVAPYLTYHRFDPAGALVESVPIDLPGPRMIHEMVITATRVVFFDLPVVFDVARALAGQVPYGWDPALPARVGILRRDDPTRAVRWIELPAPCFTFHVFGAHDDGDLVVIDLARYETMFEDPDVIPTACWHRWTIDAANGTATDARLDDRPIEFTRIDDRRMGLPYRFGYAVETQPATAGDVFTGSALVRFDLRTERSERHDFGPGRIPGEGVFVPASADSSEDGGWVLTFVQDRATASSELVILAADDFSAAPVAVVSLPRRVPSGFHAAWIPAAS